MKIAIDSSPGNHWPLARILILILGGAFANLMIDIRVEHVAVVRERSIAWLPIIYSGVMTIACLTAFVFWNQTARRIMLLLFLLAMAVGAMGFYFHTDGNVTKVIQTSINAWTDPHMRHSHAPPQLAPLAFAGLGMMGVLASLKTIQFWVYFGTMTHLQHNPALSNRKLNDLFAASRNNHEERGISSPFEVSKPGLRCRLRDWIDSLVLLMSRGIAGNMPLFLIPRFIHRSKEKASVRNA